MTHEEELAATVAHQLDLFNQNQVFNEEDDEDEAEEDEDEGDD